MGKLLIDPRILLLQRAGITDELLEAGEVDQQFSQVLEALESIHRGKEALYGNYLETHGDEPELFSLIQHFCDLKRKYVRAENFVKKRADGVQINLLEMLDTYADIAVYGAMGVQLILHLVTRGKNGNGTTSKPESSQSPGGRGEAGASDNPGGRERPRPSVFARPAGEGAEGKPGPTANIPRSPGVGDDVSLINKATGLEVAKESVSEIAERIKAQALTSGGR